MSSHVVIKTLKFCTCDIRNIIFALESLKIPYSVEKDKIYINECVINSTSNALFLEVSDEDVNTIDLFMKANMKVAEIELKLNNIKIEKNRIEQEKANQESQMYRVRQIQKEQDALAYESKKLELERLDFVNAKKQAIIDKAKSMGYSVQEINENNVVKLKLIKRVY